MSNVKKHKSISPANLARILSDKSDFATTETYKSVRTNIMFSLPKSDKAKMITVSSACPGEGKTTTAINLAITFAQTGVRTLIVDCDLRKSRVHRYLGLERGVGLSNVLCGFASFNDAVRRNVRPNLDCLTSGELPPNPSELLVSKEFQNFINNISECYDYVILDTPPMNVVTDAVVVSKATTGLVIVLRRGISTFNMMDKVVESVSNSDINVLGVIFLGSNEKKRPYKYSYKNRYIYEYNDNSDSSNE